MRRSGCWHDLHQQHIAILHRKATYERGGDAGSLSLEEDDSEEARNCEASKNMHRAVRRLAHESTHSVTCAMGTTARSVAETFAVFYRLKVVCCFSLWRSMASW